LWALVVDPIRNFGADVIEAGEQGFVEKLVPQSAIGAFTEAVLDRFAGRDEVLIDLVLLRSGRHGVAGGLGAVVGDHHAKLIGRLKYSSARIGLPAGM
jgi:hypothetical protein